jgi:hypothetical protein
VPAPHDGEEAAQECGKAELPDDGGGVSEHVARRDDPTHQGPSPGPGIDPISIDIFMNGSFRRVVPPQRDFVRELAIP